MKNEKEGEKNNILCLLHREHFLIVWLRKNGDSVRR